MPSRAAAGGLFERDFMTVNLAIRIATFSGTLLMLFGVIDFIKIHGVGGGYVSLADYWHNVVVAALGVILWCLAAALTCLAAIDAKLHE